MPSYPWFHELCIAIEHGVWTRSSQLVQKENLTSWVDQGRYTERYFKRSLERIESIMTPRAKELFRASHRASVPSPLVPTPSYRCRDIRLRADE